MRISENEIKAIKESVNSLDKGAEIYLFGSRNIDHAKGGDIDLLIISEKLSYDDTITIRKNLYEKLEEQKIHIIIAQDTTDPFVKIAYREGALL
ncbi:MAG: nucleotidyltransferase domain-containing protein [Candidatus Scalindua rubra]|uniref:Nucleotidyltransferase domain protein n=1 Tax=Candidatus Scalindua brodae TaxID=237368 RepID=A0A0B0EQJ9_9BACT|nr:MAG: Nucleotidyltransferase domain protein [Candidatus Scalindua brodae]MBZ0108740.1 nucleotidyltransferase domain-containing protein [Candidatus Scalindua rubra]TWU33066.1 Nucleotidyltransferase domain protein [Candidatus Brocadiaceae bacterium S225]